MFYFLAQPLNPDNQQPLLHIDDDGLTGSKAKGFQPAAFNGQLRSGVGLPAVGAVTDRYAVLQRWFYRSGLGNGVF